jgi:hypothetical protein
MTSVTSGEFRNLGTPLVTLAANRVIGAARVIDGRRLERSEQRAGSPAAD